MANNTLIKMKTGPISALQEKENEKPVIPLEEGSVYFAVDTTNHIGQIVYDAPDGQNGVDRIVMSTYGEHADSADIADMASIAGTANELTIPVGIDGVNFNGSSSIVHYAICSTDGDVALKQVEKEGFVLENGSRIIVRFINENSADDVYLKVGLTQEKPILYNNSPIDKTKITENQILEFIYDYSVDAWCCLGSVHQDIPDPIIYDLVNSETNGLMSSADKAKLDGIEDNANYLELSGDSIINIEKNNENVSINHVNSGVTANTYGILDSGTASPAFGQEIIVPGFSVDSKGHITNASAHRIVIPGTEVSSIANGLMTPAQAAKLDGIANNAEIGTVTSITAGVGLAGGTITESGTIKANLLDEMPINYSSNVISQKTRPERLYPISLDKDNHLAAYIPWTDTTYTTKDESTTGYLISNAELTKLENLKDVSFSQTLTQGVKIGTLSIDNNPIDLYSTEDTWIPMSGATPLHDGTAGYIGTAPVSGQQNYYLAGDGTWKSTPSDSQNVGLISYTDLSKLQALPDINTLLEMIGDKTKVLQLNYDSLNEQYVLNPSLTQKDFSDLLQSVISSDDMLIIADGNKRYYWVSLINDKATFITNDNGLNEILITNCSNSTSENVYFTKVESSVDKAEKATKDASGNVITTTYLTASDDWLVSSTTNGTLSPSDYVKLSNIENEANKTILHNDQYITLYPSSGGATTQGEVTIGHITSQASGNYGQYSSTNDEIISLTQDQNYYKFNSVGFTVDGAGHITAANQHDVKIPIASTTNDGLITSADYAKISGNVISSVTASAPIIASIDNADRLLISHTTTGANALKGETTDLPALQFGDSFKILRESVDQYGLTTLLEEKRVTIPSYDVDNDRSGLMSPADKMKLDGFSDAWNYATTDYVNAALSGLDPMTFKGVVDSYDELPQKTDSALPNYDADVSNGWTYRIGTAGEYNGYNLAAGDLIIMTDRGWMGISTDSNGALFKNPNTFTNNQMLLADGTVGRVKSVPVNPSVNFEYYGTEYPHMQITVGGFLSENTSLGAFIASTSLYGFTKLSNTPSATEETLAATPKGVNDAINLLNTNVIDEINIEPEETTETEEIVQANLFANRTLATLSEANGLVQATFQDINIDMSQVSTGVLPISQGGTGVDINHPFAPNTLITVNNDGDSFISTGHYVNENTLYINQDAGFTTDGLVISNIIPSPVTSNFLVNGNSIITDGLDLFSYTKNGSILNLHGGTANGASEISFYPDAPIHDENNNKDIQQLIDTSFADVGGYIRYDTGHSLSEYQEYQQNTRQNLSAATLRIGINGDSLPAKLTTPAGPPVIDDDIIPLGASTLNVQNKDYHTSRLIFEAPSSMQLMFYDTAYYNVPTVPFNTSVNLKSNTSQYVNSPLVSTSNPNVYDIVDTIKISQNRIEVGDYNNALEEARSGAIYANQIHANEFIGPLTGNADTATQWAAPTVTYVDLSTDSVLSELQGNEDEPVELGVHGVLGIANGGTGLDNTALGNGGALYSADGIDAQWGTLPVAQGGTGGTTQVEARQNLGVGNAKIYAAISSNQAAISDKTATCEDLPSLGTLSIGTIVCVSFAAVNTADPNNLTLQINKDTALPIKTRNKIISNLKNASSLSAGPHIFRRASNCWYIIDPVEEETSELSNSTYIKASSVISANSIVVTEDPRSGYVKLEANVDFNINYPIFYSLSAVAANSTTDSIFSNYGNIDFSSIYSSLQSVPYGTVYIKGTLSGNTITTRPDFLTTVEPTSEDGFVYIPIANLGADGLSGWFYNTGNILAFKNGSLVPMAAGMSNGNATIIQEIIKLLPASSESSEDPTNRIFKWNSDSVTIYSNNVTEGSVQRISLPQENFSFMGSDYTVTKSMADTLGAATIIDGGQGVTNGQGWFTLKSLGKVPNSEVYIRVIYEYSLEDMSSSVESAASYARQAEQILNDINFGVNAMTYYPITISSVQQDSSNVKFPYKYVVPISGLTSYDWVDAYGIDGQEWAIESGTNQIILHFSKEITQATSIVLYWIKCRLYTPDQGGN